jgi:hypothetical protein
LLPISIVLAGLAIGLGLAIGGRRIDARLERDNNFLIYLVSDSRAGTVSKCSDIGMRSCTVMLSPALILRRSIRRREHFARA